MKFDNERETKRLWDAIAHSREKLRPFRENRLDTVRQYVGSHYGNNSAVQDVPVNYIELAVSVYMQQLVGAPPRAYTSTNDMNLVPVAYNLKAVLDMTLEKIQLEETLLRVVQDAMFFQGIVKIGMTGRSPMEQGNWWSEYGEPFVCWVDPDDWVQDMTAKTDEAMAFCGNRYRVPLEQARENPAFDEKVRSRLQRTVKLTTTDSGDEKTETIAGGLDVEQDEYEDEVELWDIWLPRERKVVTLWADHEKSPPLRVMDWKGPHYGPYRIFGFTRVPGNAIYLPPVAVWQDLHDLGNALYLKLGRQALRQKSILPYRGGSEDDAERIRESADGDVLRVDGEIPKEIRYGGPDQVNLAMFLGLNEIFNRQTGNLDVMGGLSTQADTATQEEMLGANAGQRITYMRRRLVLFVDQVMTDLAHYLFNDSNVDIKTTKPLGRMGMVKVPVRWNSKTRQGEAAQFKIAIEPYSMVYRSPQSQVKQLLEVWNQVVMPAAQLIPPENLTGAIEKLLKIIADKMNLPELDLIIPHLVSVAGAGPGSSDAPSVTPPETTRNYVRHNIPGGSRSQKENALAQALLGQMPQASEAAAITR
jgi:hypothetical protein